LFKNFQPLGKKFQKTAGGIFLTHTVVFRVNSTSTDCIELNVLSFNVQFYTTSCTDWMSLRGLLKTIFFIH